MERGPQRVDLGPLEMRVLGLLRAGRPLAVADVKAELKRQNHAVAYTTVMTVLSRLHDKGLVVRQKDGHRFLYQPARATSGAKHRILERVRRSLFHTDRFQPIAHLVENDLSKSELEELKRLIEARLGKRS